MDTNSKPRQYDGNLIGSLISAVDQKVSPDSLNKDSDDLIMMELDARRYTALMIEEIIELVMRRAS